MIWTVTGVTEHEYTRGGPFWVSLARAPNAHPIILGISDRDDERSDHAKFCAKYGEHHRFFLLNDDAIEGCNAASIKLKILGSTEYDDLRGEPTVLLGIRPERKSA
jgi:hypothetical protein